MALRHRKGAEHVLESARASRTFEAIGDEWLAGVEKGRIGRRKGRGKPYSQTTIDDYRRSYRNFLRPEFGPMISVTCQRATVTAHDCVPPGRDRAWRSLRDRPGPAAGKRCPSLIDAPAGVQTPIEEVPLVELSRAS
jgi:hypothetical protein